MHDHSFIISHTFIHTIIHFIPYIQSIAYAINASQRFVLRHEAVVASSKLEQRPTEVQRPTHEGLEAASRQIEPGEKKQE